MEPERITRRGLFGLVVGGGLALTASASAAPHLPRLITGAATNFDAAPVPGKTRALTGGSRALEDPSEEILPNDIKINSDYDVARGCWLVTGFRTVDGVRYGVGVDVYARSSLPAARERVASRLLHPVDDMRCPNGFHVRFEYFECEDSR